MYSLRKGALGGAKSATACTSLRVAGAGAAEIILGDFNSAVSTPTAKLPNLNPPPNFPAIRYAYSCVGTVVIIVI